MFHIFAFVSFHLRTGGPTVHQYRRTTRRARGQLGHQYRLASRRGCNLDRPPAVDGGTQGDPVCRGRKSDTAI